MQPPNIDQARDGTRSHLQQRHSAQPIFIRWIVMTNTVRTVKTIVRNFTTVLVRALKRTFRPSFYFLASTNLLNDLDHCPDVLSFPIARQISATHVDTMSLDCQESSPTDIFVDNCTEGRRC